MQIKSIGIDLGKTTFHLVAMGVQFPSVGSKEVSRQHYWPTWRICPRRTQRRCAITVCANTDRRVTRSQIFFLLSVLSMSKTFRIGGSSNWICLVPELAPPSLPRVARLLRGCGFGRSGGRSDSKCCCRTDKRTQDRETNVLVRVRERNSDDVDRMQRTAG
jgi:hypothetical protein